MSDKIRGTIAIVVGLFALFQEPNYTGQASGTGISGSNWWQEWV